MSVMNGTLRIARSSIRYSNFLKKCNKVVVRALASQEANKALNLRGLHPVNRVDFVRKYSEWAPNIVKSQVPDYEMPNKLFCEFFWAKHDKWDDLTAMVCGVTGRELKYSQLRRLCKKLSTSLLKDGFKPGEVICIVLQNIPEYPVIAFGIMDAGLVVSTINPVYTADEIAYQLKESSSTAVFTSPETLETVLEAKKILERDGVESAKDLRIFSTPTASGNDVDLPEGIDRYSRLVADDVDESALPSLQTRSRNPSDVVFIPFSSGTSGRPKGVCLTHENLMAAILNIGLSAELQEATNQFQEVVPCILPAFHIYGFVVVMANTFYNGGKVVLLPKFEEYSFLKMLTEQKPTILYVAPPLVMYIGSSPNVTEDHLKSLRTVVSGAAPCAESDVLKCVKKSPPNLSYQQGYGLTETSPVVLYMTSGSKKYNSVGRPVSRTAVKVADLQTGQALGPNDEGELWVKGPQVMKCYLNNEKATSEVIDKDGWFHTGDIGYYDDEKDFYITDRLKELIKVKGFQVAPAELEGILRTHPDIEDVGVVGVPDPRKGETPIGFVKLQRGARVSAENLKEFLSEKVAKYKQIDTFVFVDSIPKSASGKILRKDLKQNYLKSVNLEGYLTKERSSE